MKCLVLLLLVGACYADHKDMTLVKFDESDVEVTVVYKIIIIVIIRHLESRWLLYTLAQHDMHA